MLDRFFTCFRWNFNTCLMYIHSTVVYSHDCLAAASQNMRSIDVSCFGGMLRAHIRYAKPEEGKPNTAYQNLRSTNVWCFRGIIELISGMSIMRRGKQRRTRNNIFDRYMFDAFSAFLELISGMSNQKGGRGNQTLPIIVCVLFCFLLVLFVCF